RYLPERGARGPLHRETAIAASDPCREDIDALREVLAFAFEESVMIGQSEQTAIARKLAAWAAILAVPTAIAGIYGMNFSDMTELKTQYGYF
ncbi:CorA family divalent cation transporter, partial [Rhizobium ruizarguesonis]